jgi:hypothetical protein
MAKYLLAGVLLLFIEGCSSIVENYTKVPDGMSFGTDQVGDTNGDAGDTEPADSDTA